MRIVRKVLGGLADLVCAAAALAFLLAAADFTL